MSQDISAEVRSLALGIRMVPLALILVLFYLNIGLIIRLDMFARLYADMLGGKPLPWITTFVLHGKLPFTVLAWAIMCGAVGVVFAVRNHRWALISLSGLILVSFVQLNLLWSGLLSPIALIITGMSSDL